MSGIINRLAVRRTRAGKPMVAKGGPRCRCGQPLRSGTRWTLGIALGLMLIPGWARADFRTTTLGPRPVALGQSFVAVANDLNALFLNPAGLCRVRRPEVMASYGRLLPGVKGTNLNAGFVAVKASLGFLGDVAVGVTDFSIDVYRENQLVAGYARTIAGGLALGGTAKLLRWQAEGYHDPDTGQRDDDFSYTGLSFDAGLLYQMTDFHRSLPGRFLPPGALQLGLSVRDINQPNISENGSDAGQLDVALSAGAAYLAEMGTVSLALDRIDERTKLRLGGEFLLNRPGDLIGDGTLLVRGGGVRMVSADPGGEVDLGFGVYLARVRVDYAYVYPLLLTGVGGSHKFAVSYQF